MRPHLSREVFAPSGARLKLLPFRFTRLDDSRELLVNEVGEYVIAPLGTVRSLLRRTLRQDTDLYATLRARHFIHDDASSPLLDVIAAKYRTRRGYLDGFTQLHIFVTTRRCNHNCVYCQVSRRSPEILRYDMSPDTALRSIDLMLEVPSKHVTMEFQGGEPLLNFDLLRLMVDTARLKSGRAGKDLQVVVATNLTLATDDILRYLRDQDVFVSTSLDGPAFIHDANRPIAGGSSHQSAVRGIERAQTILGVDKVAALMTTTRTSLEHPIEIVDEYIRRGFRSIFLRPINPYGDALRNLEITRYSTDEFLGFYYKAFRHILDLNRSGTPFEEGYARILLTKILTPFPTHYVDLQSPAGAGINVVVYNHDGDVYASDESRMLAAMGDPSFRLGNVHRDTYARIFSCDTLRSLVNGSVIEGLPGCADCAFQPYCGADPIYHYETQGDIVGHMPTSGFCKKNREIMRYLFSLLASGDETIPRLFFAWLRNLNYSQMVAEALT